MPAASRGHPLAEDQLRDIVVIQQHADRSEAKHRLEISVIVNVRNEKIEEYRRDHSSDDRNPQPEISFRSCLQAT
jgi:hypothetical protein